jgi:hypothetical protein
MRARFAYISSLGTTAILVAAALLMLAVVSAIVAFRGWPGQASESRVQSVPLAPNSAPARVALVRRSVTARGVERRSRAAAPRHAVSTAGLVKAAATGPRVVPGLVMDPGVAAPMSPEPSGPGRSPQGPQTAAAATPVGQPAAPQDGGPVPGGGGGLALPPIPQPVPGAPAASPTADQVTAMVGTLLGGGTPPPPVIAGISRVADGVLDLH